MCASTISTSQVELGEDTEYDILLHRLHRPYTLLPKIETNNNYDSKAHTISHSHAWPAVCVSSSNLAAEAREKETVVFSETSDGWKTAEGIAREGSTQ